MKQNKRRDDLAHEYYKREKDCDDDEVAFMAGWDACLSESQELVRHARAEAEYSLVKEILDLAEEQSALGREIEVSISSGFIAASERVMKAQEARKG